MDNPVTFAQLFAVVSAVGCIAAAYNGFLHWRMTKIEAELKEQDGRMRQGITYEQADQLIDLKLKPIADALERNTKATEKLTEVMLGRR